MQLCRKLILSITLVLTGCASQPPSRMPSDVVWDNQQQRWIPPNALNTKLAEAQYVVIGELHRSPQMRNQLLDIFNHLKSQNHLGVLFVDAFKSNANSDSLSHSSHFESVPECIADYYRPIMLWAQQQKVVLRGAATPAEKLKNLKTPEGQDWVELRTKGALSQQKQQELQEILNQSHQGQPGQSGKSQYLLATHKLNDDFMARLMVSTRQNTLLLTRAFHARTDLGVEPYIRNLKPNANVSSVLMLGNENNKPPPDNLIDSLKEYYDFIWYQKPEANLLLAPKDQVDSPTKKEQQ